MFLLQEEGHMVGKEHLPWHSLCLPEFLWGVLYRQWLSSWGGSGLAISFFLLSQYALEPSSPPNMTNPRASRLDKNTSGQCWRYKGEESAAWTWWPWKTSTPPFWQQRSSQPGVKMLIPGAALIAEGNLGARLVVGHARAHLMFSLLSSISLYIKHHLLWWLSL